MLAVANISSDLMVGRLILFSASVSMAITLVHFSSILGLPLFLDSSGPTSMPYLAGGSLISWSNSVNSSSLTVPRDQLSSSSMFLITDKKILGMSLNIHLGESRFYWPYL